MPVAPYESDRYRIWNRLRMRRYRDAGYADRERERQLRSERTLVVKRLNEINAEIALLEQEIENG